MKNTMILLVEDDSQEAALTLRALKKNNIGDRVVVVTDGVEALDFLFCMNTYAGRDPHDLPDLILLDLKLPKIDGLEVLRRIRADKRTQLLPIIILTSSSEEQDLLEGYKSGTNSYIRKPIDFTQFEEYVRQIGLYWLTINQPPPK
jgi:two-component system, response regulator